MSERQASNFRVGRFTSAHVQALNILSFNHISYLAEQPVFIWGEFDSKGRPLIFKADILINDANFGAGVIEIDRQIHMKVSIQNKDDRKDKALIRQGLWVEHIRNEDVSGIMLILNKHLRPRDDYS